MTGRKIRAREGSRALPYRQKPLIHVHFWYLLIDRVLRVAPRDPLFFITTRTSLHQMNGRGPLVLQPTALKAGRNPTQV